MITRRQLLRVAAAGVAGLGSVTVVAQRPYWPSGGEWESRTPRDAGLDPARIDDAVAYAGSHSSTGLIILRGGRIVVERYWNDWTAETAQPVFSVSKSLMATLVGIAIQEKKIASIDQRAADFIPGWKGTPKETITLRHMLSMTSGLHVGAAQVSSTVDAFAQTAALPLEHPPGTVWAYNTPVYRMLIRIVELAAHESIDAFTTRTLSGPIGMRSSRWDCSAGPASSTNCTWYRSSLRDMGRFGLLILRRGRWDSRQVVSEQWVTGAARPSQNLNESYGYLWWLNGQPSYRLAAAASGVQRGMLWPDCPPDAFGALGAQDKKIFIVPSLDLVVARHGPGAGIARGAAEGGGRTSFDNELLRRVCAAANDGRVQA